MLHEAGIEYVFGISGGHTGRIMPGLAQVQNQVRMVTVREESLAGVMAEVYGRLTRRPGVMIGQGPWVLGNGLIGTLEAYLSSSPMVLLTDFSDAPHFHLHAPYQQATGDYGSWDARRAFGGVTKQVMQALEPLEAVQATQLAIKHALSRADGAGGDAVQPGLAGRHDRRPSSNRRSIRPATTCRRRRRRSMQARSTRPPSASLAARKPVIIAGNGVRIAQAYEELQRSPRPWGCRSCTTAAGKGAFPRRIRCARRVRHVRHVGRQRLHRRGRLVLALGTKLARAIPPGRNAELLDPTRQTSSRSTSSRATRPGPSRRAVLIGDAARVLEQLRERCAAGVARTTA